MSSNQYTFYDLASRSPGSTWTPNPWKTRLVLNFKGIDYNTRWLEYPEITPELENHLPPNEKFPRYTIPAIITPDGKYMMDSRPIAEYLESKHPSPSLHLDSSIVDQVDALWWKYMGAIMPIFLNQVPKRILNDASLEHWYRTRKAFVGMSVEELEETKGGEKAWNEAEPVLREATASLKQTEGLFFLGETISYADFIWGSVLLFSERIGPDFFEEALKRTGDAQVHLDLLNAVRPWSV
ncbi:hypothetical protein N7509_007311 [Penicillium cosmopolitanum]|uniref:GST N-terminal domain-containing protein n=1 Tax=Penicillium cosmopolitanum TaxID=1131564 RepID=A0A9X0B8B7_9EURO|nr:uncharacterized protein N7509_007311 [Penicillium cosmopolitanum]KAJ5391821.1 hypothetical protein N7509_007311 [Penicillium cosmopolitanum]